MQNDNQSTSPVVGSKVGPIPSYQSQNNPDFHHSSPTHSTHQSDGKHQPDSHSVKCKRLSHPDLSSLALGTNLSVHSSNFRNQTALTSSIASALFECGELNSFDLPELRNAFIRFLDEGEVSDELDRYFTQLLESGSVNSKEDEHFHGFRPDPTAQLQSSTSNHSQAFDTTESSAQSSKEQKDREARRRRNKEASRRSRLTNKARFHSLIRSIEQLETENHLLNVWLREVESAIQEAKDLLSGTQNANLHAQPKS